MTTTKNIIRFSTAHWRIPSAENAFDGFIEGSPTAKERKQILTKVRQDRANWIPSAEAWKQFNEMKDIVERDIVVRMWDPIMLMLEDEGPYPIQALCTGVYQRENDEGKTQACLSLKNARCIKTADGYDGMSRLLKSNCDGELLLSLADIYEVYWGEEEIRNIITKATKSYAASREYRRIGKETAIQCGLTPEQAELIYHCEESIVQKTQTDKTPISYQDKLKAHLTAYKHEHLGGPPPGIYKDKHYEHILPDRQLNFLAEFRNEINSYLEKSNPQIKLHKYFHHLNSSQAFTLNLFVPFFEGGVEASNALLTALGQRAELVRWAPEAIPDISEGTNLDVVWETADGAQTFCEVKLSENDFGKARNDKRHQDKLRDIYLPRLAHHLSPELQTATGFFKSYQILRNIWHMVDVPKGRLVFLIPRGNSKLWPMLKTTLSGVSTSVRERISEVAIEDVLDNLATNEANPPHFRTYAQILSKKYVTK